MLSVSRRLADVVKENSGTLETLGKTLLDVFLFKTRFSKLLQGVYKHRIYYFWKVYSWLRIINPEVLNFCGF